MKFYAITTGEYSQINKPRYDKILSYFSIRVLAKDEEHAIKIASEKRAEYLAHDAGIA